jgi:hypothetical protein
MAQDPERDEDRADEGPVDTSEALDMKILFRSSTMEGELEANNIHSLLEANGIPSMVSGASMIPSLEFQVLVPRAEFERAEHLLEEACAAGPQAADEAEAASEEGK